MEIAEKNPAQSNEAIAIVAGQPYTQLPNDLYIPPDALEVFLEAFEGPLDLLLYLIKKQNLDILDIPIAQITSQYMQYVELMKELNLELAAEYLVMAAVLGEFKSRLLLPKPPATEEEEDPRAELVRRLQEYERFKQAAEDIDQLERINRDLYSTEIHIADRQYRKVLPECNIQDIMMAFSDVMRRAEMYAHHHIEPEQLSVRERMSQLLSELQHDRFSEFIGLFHVEEGRMGVVVTFLAILELVKESLIELVQSELYGPIYVKALNS